MKTWTLLTLLLCQSVLIAECIKFENNAYKDLMVAISPDIASEKGQIIIENIKKWLTGGSHRLFKATRGFAYIQSVNILLPKTWTDVQANQSSGLAYEDGVIRIDEANPLHKNTPYTLQPGGCGDRGEFIHVTPDFFINFETSSTKALGPLDKVFVHEWARLRYGVFEEHGYPGDPQYPLFYKDESSTVTTNFCTNVPLKGYSSDYTSGGSCKTIPETGLPDENCRFHPRGDNSDVESSIMSLTTVDNMDHFCDGDEDGYFHDGLKPNKHNEMCDRRPTWTVIKESPDFQGVLPLRNETVPDPIFNVIRPDDERFVFVLDVSGSMSDSDRIKRLKQSAERWVKFEVRDNSQVGVTKFSSSAESVFSLTKIDDTARTNIAKEISKLKAEGRTCLGAGLTKGMDVLNGVSDQNGSGGVIIFVTDGNQECPGGPDLTNVDILNRVKKTKVRIVTIAIGPTTDPHLENLAVISGGKTYFVPDGTGIEDINSAFEGSLTFQPAIPSGEMDIVIFSEFYEQFYQTNETFIIDQTLGRDVRFQMDFINNGKQEIERVIMHFPNETILNETITSTQTSPFILKFDNLPQGNYVFEVISKPRVRITYVNIVITSKALTSETMPFYTRCWVNTGNTEVDLSNTKLSVLAQVTQGNRPVLNAKVEAYIEKGDEPRPLTVQLLDNGSGADVVGNDGIYSRYFVRFDGRDGDYTIKCQVMGDENTNFITQKQQTYIDKLRTLGLWRLYPSEEGPDSPICCGSNTNNGNYETEPTGQFMRKVQGTSFAVINAPAGDTFGPVKVKDLRVKIAQPDITIEFTAPGEDLDDGTASFYDIRYTQNQSALFDLAEWELENNASTLIRIFEENIKSGNLTPVESGQIVSFQLSEDFFPIDEIHYIAMRAFDSVNNTSPISNIQRIYVANPSNGSGLSGGAIAGIVIGSLLIVLIISSIAYLAIKRKQNRT